MIGALKQIWYVLFAFGLVILAHEFGHFIVARKLKIFVEKFSFGFGPAILKIKRKTTYLISLIPLGGYVKMKGENPFSEREHTDDEFFSKTPFERILVVLAGPVANFLLAFFIFFLVYWIFGVPHPQNLPIAGDIIKGTPAHKAGLLPGDRIVSVNDEEISTWEELVKKIQPNAGKKLKIVIKRGDELKTFFIVPQCNPELKVGTIGIMISYKNQTFPFAKSLYLSAEKCVGITVLTLKYLSLALRKKIKAEISGPIGIATMIGKTANQGFSFFLNLLGLISLNLFLINLFPIPLLDGGHIVIFLWEMVRKKFPSEKTYNILQTIGLAILLMAIIFASKNDILKIFHF